MIALIAMYSLLLCLLLFIIQAPFLLYFIYKICREGFSYQPPKSYRVLDTITDVVFYVMIVSNLIYIIT